MPESISGELTNASFTSMAGSIVGSIRPVSNAVQEAASTSTIVKEIAQMSAPLGLAAVAQISIGAVLVAMVGQMVGVEQLGATSLAFGLINATAYSFAAGFSGALETVLSHSYGRDPNSKLYGIYAQRMVLLLLIVSAVLGPILAFADTLLDAIGQNPEVVYYTGVFCRVALFGVYPVMILETLRRYFACQHLNNPLSVNLVIGAIMFPFLLWPMIKVFGYIGAPFAWVLLMVGMPTSLLVYLIRSGVYKKTWGGWDAAAFHNWKPLLKLAFPSMAMMLSEWVSLEINAITAGFAKPSQLAAFSVMYQTSSILWSLVSGTFISAAVLVGNALGQGQNALARRCALLCIACSMVVAGADVIAVFALRHYLPRLFSNDEEVWEEFVHVVPFFLVYHFFDCVQSCMMGVLRGCGQQLIGAVCIAAVYSLVGVPLGIALFFNTTMGVKALWLGPAVGVSCVGFPLYVYLMFWYIKWDELAPREEDSVSLGSADEETASHCQAAEDVVVFTDTLSARHSTHSASRPATPDLLPSTASDGAQCPPPSTNTSFALFHIPQRTILLTPYLVPVGTHATADASHPHPPRLALSPLSDLSPGGHQHRTVAHHDKSCQYGDDESPSGWSDAEKPPLPPAGSSSTDHLPARQSGGLDACGSSSDASLAHPTVNTAAGTPDIGSSTTEPLHHDDVGEGDAKEE